MNDIETKINIAIDYLESEGLPISIAKVCSLADISRANLYTTHPDIVEKIKALKIRNINQINHKTENKVKQNSELIDEIKELKKKVQMLSLVCLELKTELDFEREKNESLSKKG